MTDIPTLVIGASDNNSRYSNIAMRKLKSHGHTVYAIGRRAGEAHGITIQTSFETLPPVHTITLYVSPQNLIHYSGLIDSIKPKRVIFNPGTWDANYAEILKNTGIQVERACTLVMLSDGQY